MVGPGSGVGHAFGPDIGTGPGVVKALLGITVASVGLVSLREMVFAAQQLLLP